MAATWGLLGGLLLFSPHELLNSRAGLWSSKVCAPIEYALTQPEVILRYLKLSFWPHPLVLDYQWPLARDWGSILLPSLLIGGLMGSTLWALRCHPRVGFMGAWFFLTLAPTSSVIPIADPAAEHRIYLPLAAVTVVSVFCGYKILLRLFPLQVRFRRILAIGLLTLGVMTLGALTFRRNQDYLSETAIWRATVEKRPENPRAHNNLGLSLIEQRKPSEAMRVFTEGLQLHPTYAPMHSHLGRLLAEEGRLGEAITHLTIALRLQPDSPGAHNDLGVALAKQGNLAEAASRFVGAVRLKPDFKEALQNLELTEERMGRRGIGFRRDRTNVVVSASGGASASVSH